MCLFLSFTCKNDADFEKRPLENEHAHTEYADSQEYSPILKAFHRPSRPGVDMLFAHDYIDQND